MCRPRKFLLALSVLFLCEGLTLAFAEEHPLPQLRVFSRAGQTFATWTEVGGEGVTYNLYQADGPITTEGLQSARLVATGIPQGSAHDFIADRIARFRARVARRQTGATDTQPDPPPQNFTAVVKEGPLPAATGLFVYTLARGRVSFYALTAVWPAGGEDRRVQVGTNSQLEKVAERPDTTGPILLTREGPPRAAPNGTAAGARQPDAGAGGSSGPAAAGASAREAGAAAGPGGSADAGKSGEVRLDYLHWASPEQASVDGHPYRFRVILKADEEKTAGLGLIVRLHPYTGNYTMTTWTRPGFVTLGLDDFTPAIDEVEHHSFWFGYPESLGRSGRGAYLTGEFGGRSAGAGPVAGDQPGAGAHPAAVRDYTQKRISWAIEGVAQNFRVDRNRVYLTGSSMGGTGTVGFGLRRPDLFAALDAVVPLINPGRSTAWGHELLGKLWGGEDWPALPDGEGHTLGERLDDTACVLSASADLPLLKFFNARQDTAIGWTQIPEFIQALQQARQPFLSAWDNGGHGGPRAEVTQSFQDFDVYGIPRTQCVPALANASTADDPGNGDPAAGDPVGAINDDFRWAVEKDTATELVLHLWRVPKSGRFASVTEATVDVTPRRRQAFHPPAGSQVTFQDLSAADGSVLQQASITVEPTGLFTARQVRVSPEPGSRLVFSVTPATE